MRHDDLYLVDIIETAALVARMAAGVDREAFLADDVLASALQYRLMIIGEACGKLELATLALMPEVPADRVRGFRNRLVHGYFEVDLEVVWEVATRHVPSLAAAAERVLAELFPDTFRKLEERSREGLG